MAKVQVACMPCRRRKVRCDGADPCSNCRNSGIPTECDYKGNNTPGMLRRGAACLSCRQRKKKCDGRKPSCSTCTNPDDCSYDAEGQWIPVPTAREQREPSPQIHEIISSPTFQKDMSDPLCPVVVTRSPIHIDVGVLRSSPVTPTSPLVFHHRILTPRNSVVQYSTIFFTHRIQLGVSFTDAKSEAIKTGDLSGETIHPALVHISYMWGSVLWQGLHSENYLDDERSLFKLAMDCLEDGSCRSPDPVESLQACYLLSIYCFTRQDLARGRQFHIDAAQVIADNQLHISDPHHPVQSPFDIEQMHAVCQLLLSDSTPVNPFKMESSLSRALVHELERVITTWPDLDVFIMQTVTVILLQRAREHNSEACNDPTDPSSAWFARHFELLNQIYRYIAIIQSYILRISSAPSDVLDTLGLKQCVVLLLAGEIILYEKFARWHMESSRRSFVSALKIVDISSTFAAHEIFLLDPMILIGWKTAANVFNMQWETSIEPLSDANSTMLMEKIVFLERCESDLKTAMPLL